MSQEFNNYGGMDMELEGKKVIILTEEMYNEFEYKMIERREIILLWETITP